MTALQHGSGACSCGRASHEARLVALTGGPGAGKTAVLEVALRSFCEHVAVLPEAASVVFGGGFPRHSTEVGRRASQRAIYHVQREVEAVVLGERRVAVGLCDRGTVDGVAYWPDEPGSFWPEVGTSLPRELERYAVVIHLRTPSEDQGYNRANRLRVEDAEEARQIDERILEAWKGHPARVVVDSEEEFVDKAARALAAVRERLPDCCREHAVPGEA